MGLERGGVRVYGQNEYVQAWRSHGPTATLRATPVSHTDTPQVTRMPKQTLLDITRLYDLAPIAQMNVRMEPWPYSDADSSAQIPVPMCADPARRCATHPHCRGCATLLVRQHAKVVAYVNLFDARSTTTSKVPSHLAISSDAMIAPVTVVPLTLTSTSCTLTPAPSKMPLPSSLWHVSRSGRRVLIVAARQEGKESRTVAITQRSRSLRLWWT